MTDPPATERAPSGMMEHCEGMMVMGGGSTDADSEHGEAVGMGMGKGMGMGMGKGMGMGFMFPRVLKVLFVIHFVLYATIVGMLGYINLAMTPDMLWFLFPAVGWGVLLIIHALIALMVGRMFGSRMKA